MYNFGRYAVSPEAWYEYATPDYSVTYKDSGEPSRVDFDPIVNLELVLSRAIQSPVESEDLRYTAAAALQRLTSRSEESVDDWANRLAPTFFADLENRSS
ncbi:hypothetical protein SAMN05877838_2695 [Hoeflea halophila]|uniref:Uncharacterized protein n=1 Tax=Hoeflea halophila TaxID=714899 RepID=A0A286ICK4_9HYPH|nr:hypothetical protein SAMN05877838_2695 [Hoeflea halophila]